MFLLLILIICSLIVYEIHYKETKFYPLLALYIPMLLYIFFLIEVQISSLEYFISDEKYYWNPIEKNNIISHFDRVLWYQTNFFLKHIDIGGIVAIKLISIPILFLALYMLWKLFFKDKKVFMLVIFLPYFSFLATKNLRDILILFFIISTFFVLYKVKYGKVLIFIPLTLLFFTRPFLSILCFIIISVEILFRKYIIVSFKERRFALKKQILLYVLAIFFVTFAIKLIPYIDSRINSYIAYFNYLTIDQGYEDLKEYRLGEYATGNKIKDYLIGASRYFFSPIPTSILMRTLEGGTDQWGLLDDIIRTINQVFYYFFILYALYNFKSIYSNFKLIEPGARQLIIVLLFFLPIYSFYGFGVTHQRNKLPFQLAFFLFFILNENLKNKKNAQMNKITN